MQNPKKNFRQSLIAFEKLGILCKKLITTDCHRVEYFQVKLFTRFLKTPGC